MFKMRRKLLCKRTRKKRIKFISAAIILFAPVFLFLIVRKRKTETIYFQKSLAKRRII